QYCPIMHYDILNTYDGMQRAIYFFFLMIRRPPRSTLFPTRRSSDLMSSPRASRLRMAHSSRAESISAKPDRRASRTAKRSRRRIDRKSTRLNSSHVAISYAVFCLKKKKDNSFLIEVVYSGVYD